MIETKLLLTYREAWEMLGYSRSRFYAEVAAGRIKTLPTRSGMRIVPAELEDYVRLLQRERDRG